MVPIIIFMQFFACGGCRNGVWLGRGRGGRGGWVGLGNGPTLWNGGWNWAGLIVGGRRQRFGVMFFAKSRRE